MSINRYTFVGEHRTPAGLLRGLMKTTRLRDFYYRGSFSTAKAPIMHSVLPVYIDFFEVSSKAFRIIAGQNDKCVCKPDPLLI